MDGSYTIGQLARAADVPVSTVRFYERRGLLRPNARSAGNYRVYGDDAVMRLRFVRSAQAAGFTLSDIAILLRFRAGDTTPCGQVQELITARLRQVRKQVDELRQVDRMLGRWLKVCRESERSGRCGVLEGLLVRDEKMLREKSKSP